MIKFLLEKEFKQIIRNPFLPRMIFLFPTMVLLLLPWAATYDIKNINLAIIDNDKSSYSNLLKQKVISSGYFILTSTNDNYSDALEEIELDNADIILEIPSHFERRLISESASKISINANAVNGTKGAISSTYLSSIINDFNQDILIELVPKSKMNSIPTIEINSQFRFNIFKDYKIYMVPALTLMLLTIICGFLPALNIVSEKEQGTMEQINVTPVTKFYFITSKLIPYWLIGFIVMTLSIIIAYLVYDLVPLGNLLSIYTVTALYILAVSGFGLVISNYSNTMQQAMFVMYFFLLIFILISGLFTPIESMPQWAQNITYINPLKYYIETIRLIYLKGSGLKDIVNQLIALSIFVIFFNLWAIISYKKRG